jgi:hypothetical protein
MPSTGCWPPDIGVYRLAGIGTARKEQEKLPGVIIGLVRPPAVDGTDFLRWAVLDAGDALLEFGSTVETMACTEGSIAGRPGEVRFDALIWAQGDTAGVTPLLIAGKARGALDSWTVFSLGTERVFERGFGEVAVEHPDDPFSDLPGATMAGLRKLVFHCRLPDISTEKYRAIFRDHFPLTEVHMARALRYWQREVERTDGPSSLAADGVSEFRAADHDHIMNLYDNPESAAIVGADSNLFIDRSRTCTLFGITHIRNRP